MPATNTAPPVTYETLATAATRTGVSTRTLRRRIAEGKLIAYRLGPRLIRLNSAAAGTPPAPGTQPDGPLVAPRSLDGPRE